MAHANDEPGLSPGKKRPWLLPLNNPPMIGAPSAKHMRADDLVVGVIIDGRARAYPWWIVANYHVVNDTVVTGQTPAGYLIGAEDTEHARPLYPWFDSVPLLVTLCEACAGAAAFVPVLDDAPSEPLVFTIVESGSGFTAAGTFTICDLRTRSRWHPLVGRAGSGPLAGRELRRVASFVDRWDAWQNDHPETEVVFAGDEMRSRPHAVDHMPAVFDPDGAHTSVLLARKKRPETIDGRLPRGELVLGAAFAGGQAVAYPLELLRKRGGVAQVDVNGIPCLFVASGSRRGVVFSRRLDDRVLDFVARGSSARSLVDDSGTEWNAAGEALRGEYSGRQLRVLSDTYVSKWSEWSMSHPSATIAD